MEAFLCGIEIHQRLKGGKLFCRCSNKSNEKKEKTFIRELHLVRSELDQIDEAALMETQKKLRYRYVATDNSCLVELDEEPPNKINQKALENSLRVALALNCKIPDELFIMRKTVLDGSNTSGFQRTLIVGLDGWIETSKGKVGIQSVCLEEESCGIINEAKDNEKIYSLDRLGIPLVEIATAPDIKDYGHAREVAEHLGLLLRALNIAERGIGTIRQDLNVSVAGGARVEIKGIQELESIPKVVEYEVLRQKKLIELHSRYTITADKKIWDVTDAFRSMKNLKPWIVQSIESGKKCLCITIKRGSGALGYEILPNRRFGTELSDYAKSTGVKGIIHSDEDMEKYGIEKELITSNIGMHNEDAFVLVIADEDQARRALSKVIERVNMKSLPKETRRVIDTHYTEYLRPLPGSHRMYPETDLPSIKIDRTWLEQLKKSSLNLEQIVRQLEEFLSDRELAVRLIKNRYYEVFLDVKELYPGFEKVVAQFIVNSLPNCLSRASEEKRDEVAHAVAKRVIELFVGGKITKSAIPEVGTALAEGRERDVEKYLKISGRENLLSLLKECGSVNEVMKRYGKRIDIDELKDVAKLHSAS